MQRFVCVLAITALVFGLAGCNTLSRQPRMQEARITPSDLKPGDTAIIAVKVNDPHNVVERVEGMVLEDQRVTLRLRDDGVEPDSKAGDNIWTLRVDVPFQAPPGEFTLEFTAFRSDGQPVVVLDENRNAAPLRRRFGMVIRYPDEVEKPKAPAESPTPAEAESGPGS
ncbi:MAG TPA: hypothetical protein ENN80_08705 [Candidatus Hydrogenedentes bacterium]|nr:hypothetical protein [Candidatus Hydrogenedentota bacterium]